MGVPNIPAVKATKFTGDGSDLQVGNGLSVKKALSQKVDDTTFKTKLGDKVDTITFNTALDQKAALNGLPDQDFHASVINAKQIVTTVPIDSDPHWDSKWFNVVAGYPEFIHTCEHKLGVIPSRYTLQFKAQNAPDDVHILTGGGVVTFELFMVDPVGKGMKITEYKGPFHFYPAITFNITKVELRAYLAIFYPKKIAIGSFDGSGKAVISIGRHVVKNASHSITLTSAEGAFQFRILLWK